MSKLLFSLTARDFKWDYFRGSGKGGQKRNKTSSGVRCTHEPSGAVGVSDDTRSQHKNKEIAFERMASTREFKNWHRMECARRTGEGQRIKEYVEDSMRHIKVEKKEGDRWVDF